MRAMIRAGPIVAGGTMGPHGPAQRQAGPAPARPRAGPAPRRPGPARPRRRTVPAGSGLRAAWTTVGSAVDHEGMQLNAFALGRVPVLPMNPNVVVAFAASALL